MIVSIPFSTWLGWTLQERADVELHYESQGIKWVLDMNAGEGNANQRKGFPLYPASSAHQKDRDEYIEEMSLGGQRYDPV